MASKLSKMAKNGPRGVRGGSGADFGAQKRGGGVPIFHFSDVDQWAVGFWEFSNFFESSNESALRGSKLVFWRSGGGTCFLV